MTKDQLLTEAMTLDPREREALAEELLFSLNGGTPAAVDAAWLAEARRRDAAYAAGDVTASPAADAVARVLARGRP